MDLFRYVSKILKCFTSNRQFLTFPYIKNICVSLYYMVALSSYRNITENKGPPSRCANHAFFTTAILSESTEKRALKFVWSALPIPSNTSKSTLRFLISLLRPVTIYWAVTYSWFKCNKKMMNTAKCGRS